MEEFVAAMVKSHNAKFRAGLDRLAEKEQAWDACVNRTVNYFEVVKKECESQGLFENIYIVDSRKHDDTKYQLPAVSIYFGDHPLGYYNFGTKKLAIEGGCTLSISQSVLGNVIITYHPFESELLKVNEKYLIAQIFHAPWSVTDIALDRLTNGFFSYAQVSSAFGSPSILDHYTVIRLRICHWWIHFNLQKAIINLLLKTAKSAIEIGKKMSLST